ncbi:hypothetical protein T440DRAFT_519332 [Plenodomus tracheiphilus IPT5]|uniref:Uncharacterized protein n=1 Tax=Plenodomus tracheiphilus IPT5 TaxID=1408161 RepID=A0A6A7B1A6_9PLEO|nr:hypothetical protein T440DRAFT_519332 [Plenodomus tracheiphilus IPT5]
MVTAHPAIPWKFTPRSFRLYATALDLDEVTAPFENFTVEDIVPFFAVTTILYDGFNKGQKALEAPPNSSQDNAASSSDFVSDLGYQRDVHSTNGKSCIQQPSSRELRPTLPRYNNLYIGINTLFDFHGALASIFISKLSKLQVITAFLKLSSQEPNDPRANGFKLGSVKLVDVLKGIDFDEDGKATNAAVMKTRKTFARKDAQVLGLDARLVQGSREVFKTITLNAQGSSNRGLAHAGIV